VPKFDQECQRNPFTPESSVIDMYIKESPVFLSPSLIFHSLTYFLFLRHPLSVTSLISLLSSYSLH
jgi:hypothetical protein